MLNFTDFIYMSQKVAEFFWNVAFTEDLYSISFNYCVYLISISNILMQMNTNYGIFKIGIWVFIYNESVILSYKICDRSTQKHLVVSNSQNALKW